MALISPGADVVDELARCSGAGLRSGARPVSCPVHPLRRFVGSGAQRPSADTAEICRLLEWAYGHRRPVVLGQRATRRAPSAGALYPIEVFLVVDGTVAYYDFADHRLHPVASRPVATIADRLRLDPGDTGVVLVSVMWRTVQRYGARGYRYCHLDAAHVAANLVAAAGASGRRVRPAPFPTAADLDALLGLRRGEHTLLAMAVAPGGGPDRVPTPSVAPPPRVLGGSAEQPPVLNPAMERVVRMLARSLTATPIQDSWRQAVRPGREVFDLLDRRFSARDFTGALLADPQLDAMRAAGEEALHLGFTEGTAPIRVAALGSEVAGRLANACQRQAIVARSALALVVTVDSTAINAHGHAGYRRAVVNAGLATAALYRTAAEHGIATTSIGGFSDPDVAHLLGDEQAHPIVIQLFGQANSVAGKVDAAPIVGCRAT